MYALIAASVESSNPCCAVVSIDVMHTESGRVFSARVFLGVEKNEIAVDAVEAHGVDEQRELETFVRSVRDELEARLVAEAEA